MVVVVIVPGMVEEDGVLCSWVVVMIPSGVGVVRCEADGDMSVSVDVVGLTDETVPLLA